MYKRLRWCSFFLLFFIACSENTSSPQVSQELSSSDEAFITDFSSSSIDYEDSSSSGIAEKLSSSKKIDEISSSSREHKGSSNSEKSMESSSSNDIEYAEVSSCSAKEYSSSSVKVEESSSSVEIDVFSSSEMPLESSSSEEIAESSSSFDETESSSSEYYKLSWDYLNPSISYDTIIDSRDGQVYKVVTVDNQTWMAENLNYYDTIQFPDLKQHSRCLDDQLDNCAKYGRLYDNPIALDYDSTQISVYKRYKNEEGGYDSLSVVGICPDGWRIPTRSEWLLLDKSCPVRSALWNGKNTCGISVMPSGLRYVLKDSVSYFHDEAYFWTASYNSTSQPSTIVFEKTKLSGIYGAFRGCNLSIRCIKNN